MSELLLGLDIGTSSSKGVLVTTDGTVVARAERQHNLSIPRPGWAEHDVITVWWDDAVRILRELTSAADGPIVALGASGIGPCFAPVDAGDRPLRPAILYGIDTRATAEISELTTRYGADRILSRGGSALTSQAVGPKLLWLQRHEPEVWHQTRRIFMASSYLVRRLTGAYVLDHHSASQCDPLYDMAPGDWSRDWAGDIAPEIEFPELLWPAEVAGHVTAEAASLTGLPAGIPMVAGTIDAWAEATSVGVRRPGDTMLMYGTTMFIVEVVDRFVPGRTLWVTAGVEPGSRTLAAGMSTSGALTGWFRDLVGMPPFEALVAEASAVPAGSHGLVVLPYFAGERTPIFDADARGLILGLTLEHTRGHVYRALLESTGYGVRHILAALREAGSPPRRLVAVGGGTKGGLWTRIVSNITGITQEVPAVTIGAAYGDALMAGVGAGLVEPGADWSQVAEVVEPDAGLRGTYDELYDTYLALYPATRDQAHGLAALQRREGVPAGGVS
jgi:xylulokinase